MNKLSFFTRIIFYLILTISCHENVAPRREAFNQDYMSHIDPANFVTTITNPFLPLTAGSTFVFSSETSKGLERGEFEVLPETKTIMGITCTVVRDIVYLNGEVIEDTYDWFAQDKEGNVWYMGERVDNYVNGVVDNHYGSWEAGVDGAEPGIMMLKKPATGLYYRQEHYLGSAEDQAEVVSTNATVTVEAGTFKGCIRIKETNPLDPTFLEYKYYSKGVGLVKIEKIGDPTEIEELTSYIIN